MIRVQRAQHDDQHNEVVELHRLNDAVRVCDEVLYRINALQCGAVNVSILHEEDAILFYRSSRLV